jgi:hypothetical protein
MSKILEIVRHLEGSVVHSPPPFKAHNSLQEASMEYTLIQYVYSVRILFLETLSIK